MAMHMATTQGEVELRANGNDVGYDIRLRADMETWFEQPLRGCVAERGGIVDPYLARPRFGNGDAMGMYNHS